MGLPDRRKSSPLFQEEPRQPGGPASGSTMRNANRQRRSASRLSVRKSPAVSRSLLAFLEVLASNNDRTWFEKNRGRYEEYVLRPLKALVKELAGFMLSIDPDLDVRPRVGG